MEMSSRHFVAKLRDRNFLVLLSYISSHGEKKITHGYEILRRGAAFVGLRSKPVKMLERLLTAKMVVRLSALILQTHAVDAGHSHLSEFRTNSNRSQNLFHSIP